MDKDYNLNLNEMARAIVLTSDQWFLLSGTENTDGGLIINRNEMQKNTKETSTIYCFKLFTYNVCLPIVCRSGYSIHTAYMLLGLEDGNVFLLWLT
jgi:hypothetical protein